jgi:hypothetical protein
LFAIRLKQIGTNTADTLAADFGLVGVKIAPLLCP